REVRQHVGNLRLRQLLVLITQTKAQSQCWSETKIILKEEIVVVRAEVKSRGAECLQKIAVVALPCGPGRTRANTAGCPQRTTRREIYIIQNKVIDRAIGVRAFFRTEVIEQIVDPIDIEAEPDRVISARQRDR